MSPSTNWMMMTPRTARIVFQENVAVILVRALILPLLRARRHLHRHLAEAVGRGPGNRRGVPS